MRKYCINLLALVCINSVVSNLWAQPVYYRYKDTEGNTAITTDLPPEAAQKGYEVVSPQGNVVETVAPAKSDKELLQQKEIAQQQQNLDKKNELEKEQVKIQAHKDDVLLKSFSSEIDITRTRDEKITAIEVQEGIVKDNLKRLQNQLDEANNSAQNYQKNNQPIPENLQTTISETKRQINDNQVFLDHKKQEKDQFRSQYQNLLDRFHKLQTH